ncbi:PxORF41 peptide [Plutella xylostella granulovirus]|jgi:hypothetical protein|uniref:ORF40 protein n=1 Tax=Plutella xylostella granulovirus TaxID=98383 RepID=Q9DVZ1_9BBAC|nr:PxORF41 peptide [Plutella xylostella granulovirus]AAG27339.1 PxORF41 peptide [Plutella xylostella granulovirus]AMQ35652.1 PxGV-Corf40 protein [Plutella xylostella granulovirus]AMQ35769.1 PxGV-Korf40 protein [Plutella xylostella granulovirus]AMQ35886.1 PxGV-Morf40 protein [Plutella xylostella granulovirus]AMQ36003.1 PxGV-Torf40 protein [Plutella xylostella granulovirus]
MMLPILFLSIVTVIILYILKLNRGQMNRLVYYKYKFIPEPLAKHVRVHRLKIF